MAPLSRGPRIRKCDECRRRKKKCDKARCCSLCSSIGISCEYSAAPSMFVCNFVDPLDSESPVQQQVFSSDVDLHLRSSWHLPSGVGDYYTFDSGTKKKRLRYDSAETIKSPPLSFTERLICDFIALLGLRGKDQNFAWLWDNWSAFVPSRIGSSKHLDYAIICVVEARRAQQTQDQRHCLRARTYYINALHLLQQVMASPEPVEGQTIAATKILESCETLLELGSQGWRSHSNGAVQLFLAAGPQICQNDFERALLYSVYSAASADAVMKQELSLFDDPEWFAVGPPPPSTSDSNCAEAYSRFSFFTKLPRAQRLVRNLSLGRRTPSDFEAAADILIELVNHELDQTPYSLDTLAPPYSVSETTVPTAISYPEPVFENSLTISVRCAKRIILCGLLQTAILQGVRSIPLSIEGLQLQEQRCARLICMSTPSMLSKPLTHNIASAIFPLQMAWSALFRQFGEEAVQAESNELMTWLTAKIDSCAQVLGFETSKQRLVIFTRRMTGSPLAS